MKRLPLYILICCLTACAGDGANQKEEAAEISHDWYSVKFQELCKSQCSFQLDLKRKYGIRNPYYIWKETIGDSTFLNFDFNDDCCLEYTGELFRQHDGLVVGFYIPSDSIYPCSCYCNYRMTFAVKNNDSLWNKVFFVNGRTTGESAYPKHLNVMTRAELDTFMLVNPVLTD